MICIGSRTFRSQESVRSLVRRIVSQHEPGTVVADEDAHAFLLALFERHPSKTEKLQGQEISAFLVMSHTLGHKELWLRRGDGSQESFSWRACVTGKTMPLRACAIQALRNVAKVRPHELDPPRERCDACGVYGAALEVDHVEPTFNDIASFFLDDLGESVVTDLMYKDQETNMYTLPADSDVYRFFKAFHDGCAVLQALCVPCHQRKTEDDRVKKSPRTTVPSGKLIAYTDD